uniref:Nucleosome assembly protein n=1 Tax=Loa loa TaxID=7209 RepID=A0A1I7VAP0_LOALO
MSTSLNKSAQSTIDRVIELLEEIKKLDLSPPDRNQPLEDQKQQYEIKKRIVKDNAKRFEIYVGILETINQKWLDLIQQATKTTKKEEEEKYEEMVNDKQAIHLQGNPNIQKLTYLTSCLKGEALEAIRGFDIAPENYELIRQVLIDKYGNPATIKTERNCTRFLWLKDIQGEIIKENLVSYRFQKVPFGVNHLKTYGSKTALEIKKNLYVDNVISPLSGTEAFKSYNEMEDIFKNALMNIREFFSNDNDFNELIPENDRAEVS